MNTARATQKKKKTLPEGVGRYSREMGPSYLFLALTYESIMKIEN
jgi:hypothetical protein